MYELRPQPKPTPKLGALPQADLSKLLSVVNPVRSQTATIAMDTKTAELEALVAFGNAARQWGQVDRSYDVGHLDLAATKKWLDEFTPTKLGPVPGLDGADPNAPAEEPFLHVILDAYDPPAVAGDPNKFRERFHYSDIDRPVGSGAEATQLDGRVIEVGSVARRFNADHGLGRTTTTLRLRNNDRALDALFRGTDFLRVRIEIRVGFRTIPPRWYRKVGPTWRIDRVNAITADYVELSLIDATDVLLGKMARPLLKQSVMWALDPNARGQAPYGSDTAFAPVAFGTEWVRAFIARRRTYAPTRGQSKYSLQLCLGVSLNPTAVGPRVTGRDIANGTTDYRWRVGIQRTGSGQDKSIDLRLGPNHVPGTFDLEIYVSSVPVGPDATGRTWYAAILTLEYYIYQGVSAHAVSYVSDIETAAEDGRLYVQWPYGAEGKSDGSAPWSGKHDPASIMELIVTRYMDTTQPSLLHKPAFERARKNFAWTGMGKLGGFYEDEGIDGAEVINAIARTFEMDLVWDADGKVRVATPHIGPADLLSMVPGCPVYSAEWDIVRDSWTETIPLGSERWGLANRFNHQGEKDNTEFGVASQWLNNTAFYGSPEKEIEWGRLLEADIDWSWINTTQVRDNGNAIDFPLHLHDHKHTPHCIAELYAPLFALELECGAFLRISHWAGSQAEGGYQNRLFRVEEVGLDWTSKRVKLVLVDMDAVEERKSAAFDDETRWVRLGRETWDGLHRVQWPGGSLVQLIGPLFTHADIKIGDFIRVDSLNYNARITDILINNPTGVTVNTDQTQVSGSAPTFRVERSHIDPPSDTGRYPLGSDFYFRSCDEASGLFSDGSPGYRAEKG